MRTHEILHPLFDVVNKIHCDTDINLDFGIRTYSPTHKTIYWYVGDCSAPDAGIYMDRLDVQDLNGDKLFDWIQQLTELYVEATGDVDISDFEEDESRDEIAARETAVDNQLRIRT